MKIIKAIILLLFVYSSSISFSAPLTELPEELQISILDYLDVSSLCEFIKTGNNSLSRKLLGPNGNVRKHVFDVILRNPKAFVRHMLKAIPHDPETIDADSYSFYQELIGLLPTYENSLQKFAVILIELLTWDDVIDQVRREIGNQFNDELSAQAGVQAKRQVWDELKTQTRAQSRFHVWDQIADYAKRQGKSTVSWHITQFKFDYLNKMRKDLPYLQFLNARAAESLNQEPIPAIEYALMVYQVGILKTRFCAGHLDIYRYITERVTETQADAILAGLDIPGAPEGSHFIDFQLKLIKRHLPNAE